VRSVKNQSSGSSPDTFLRIRWGRPGALVGDGIAAQRSSPTGKTLKIVEIRSVYARIIGNGAHGDCEKGHYPGVNNLTLAGTRSGLERLLIGEAMPRPRLPFLLALAADPVL
jgi:hypothetical protein